MPVESHSGARGGESILAGPYRNLILTETSCQLSTRKTSHAGPSPVPLSTGLSFATRQLGDRGLEPDIHRTRRRQIPYNRNRTSHLRSCTQCTVAVAYTFSDFCYKLEHTSVVVILTLTDIRHAVSSGEMPKALRGVGNGKDIAHYRLWCHGVWSWILDLQS